MLWALLVMMLGMTALFALVVMLRIRTDIYRRRADSLESRGAVTVSQAQLEDVAPGLSEARSPS
jgi:hypothetical protein